MEISKQIGDRILKLMKENKISLRSLSEIIGISHPTLKRYVDGEQPIDSEKLMKISKHFGKNFEYFFKEDSEDFQFLFRADNPDLMIKKNDIENLKSVLMNYIDIVNNIKYNYVPQSYSLKINGKRINSIELELIEKIAYENRRMLNIESIIPENYYEVIEKAGINIIARDFYNDSFFGASSYSVHLGSFILINNSQNISEERKIFSLIHEFAHLLFHREQYSDFSTNQRYSKSQEDINELIANKFAAYFLMPRALVKEYLDSRISDVNLIEMKKYFKVSKQSLIRILYEYKYIDKEEYNDFWEKISKNDLMKVEEFPLDELSLELKNKRLINNIKDLYFNENISANKISEVLGLDIIETRKLLKKWRDSDELYIHL